jgi:acyloxyacyl hydrolase
MTKPDEFYSSAIETLVRLDKLLPPGSHVIALALFDGELLYDTMHRHQHPVGASYEDLYEFMNCLEENPCWGWLNSNATNRRLTTQRSNELNRVYRRIENEQAFQNFKFIFYR